MNTILRLLVFAACATSFAADRTSPPTDHTVKTLPDVDAPSADEIRSSIDRGVEFLLQNQKPSGAWGGATRTKGLNIYAPVPGAHDAFRAATTALCISTLLEYGTERKEIQSAVERAEAWLMKSLPDLKRATGDAMYNVWGHTYSIQALVRLHRYHSAGANADEHLKQIEDMIRLQFD